MTREQLKQALDVCSEHEACGQCPSREYCGDLSVVTGEALNVIERLEKEREHLQSEICKADQIIDVITIPTALSNEIESIVKRIDERLSRVSDDALEKALFEICKKVTTQEKSECKHLDDPNWDKWWCGDCGDYCMKNGCRGPKGRSDNNEK